MATSNTRVLFLSLCLILSQEAFSQFDELWLVGDDDPLNALQTRRERRGERCDYSVGKWMFDETYPLYDSSCPYLSSALSCQRNGRPDSYYQKWRWIPKACSLPRHTPHSSFLLTSYFFLTSFSHNLQLTKIMALSMMGFRFDALKFLGKMRGKRIMLVGDSIMRNQWESLVCLVQSVIPTHRKKLTYNGPTISFHSLVIITNLLLDHIYIIGYWLLDATNKFGYYTGF